MNDNDSREKRRLKIQPGLQRQWVNGNVSVHLVAGITIVILGVLSLLKNLDVFELRSVSKYFFAAVFLALGSAMVIENRNQRMWQWGIGWIVIGIWMFAYKSGWIHFDIWDLFWPVVLLGVGGYLVHRSVVGERSDSDGGPVTIDADNPDAPPRPNRSRGDTTIRGIGILSGSDLKPTAQAMERAELFAMMGGVKLDLYDAQLVNDQATINVAACMGGIEIHIPSEWTVISNVLPLMGAYIDKRRPPAGTTPTAPKKTLTINGFVLMGGVEIKN
jgi:hypothetical protein